MAYRGPPGEHIRMPPNAARAVDEYWEYTRLAFSYFLL